MDRPVVLDSITIAYREPNATTIALERAPDAPSFWDAEYPMTIDDQPLRMSGRESISLLVSFRPDGSL